MTFLVYSLSYEVKMAFIGKSVRFAISHLVKSLKRCNAINDSTLATNFVLKYMEFLNILLFTPFSSPKFLLDRKKLTKFTNK